MVAKGTTPAQILGNELNVIDWTSVNSVDDLRAVAPVIPRASEVLGDGVDFIADKNRLCGVNMYVLTWKYNKDNANREYATILVMDSKTGQKGRFNDGSTGVYAQTKTLMEEYGQPIPFHCPGGLRRSDYFKEGIGDATTFYFDC